MPDRLNSHGVDSEHINHLAQGIVGLTDGCMTCAMELALQVFAAIATQPIVREHVPLAVIRAGLDNTFIVISEEPDGRPTTH